jgi:AraC family transcriptional regulator of adaptative response/methylated-DNA-[protein]-cysteine methyltransferase
VSYALKSSPQLDSIEDERWQAVLSRDTRYDGQFVFAVSSTNIYCRPSCPSRRPHRDRVSFFSIPEAAEQAGFRACLRCEPKRARVLDPQIEMVQNICRYLDATESDEVRLSDMAMQAGVSVFHLQRTFQEHHWGESAPVFGRQEIRRLQIPCAKRLIGYKRSVRFRFQFE